MTGEPPDTQYESFADSLSNMPNCLALKLSRKQLSTLAHKVSAQETALAKLAAQAPPPPNAYDAREE